MNKTAEAMRDNPPPRQQELDPAICDGCGKRKRGWRATNWLFLCIECEEGRS